MVWRFLRGLKVKLPENVYIDTCVYLYIHIDKYLMYFVSLCIFSYTHTIIMKYDSAIKKNGVLPFVTWIDLESKVRERQLTV